MDAAARAQKEWMALTASARGRVMNEIARRIREHAPLIAEIESRSAGRPIRDIRGEAVRVAEMFEYYAGWCDKLYGDVIPVPSSHLNYTRHEPIGVVTQITPWNAPLFTGGWPDSTGNLCGERCRHQAIRVDAALHAYSRPHV